MPSISLENITSSLISFERLITAGAYLMGISFAVKAIYSMKTLAEQKSQMSQHGNVKEPAIYFLVAAMLIYFPTGFEMLMRTTFGYSQVLAYADVDSGSQHL